MASTKVMVRDKTSASLGGNLLSLNGAQAHNLSLNLAEQSHARPAHSLVFPRGSVRA